MTKTRYVKQHKMLIFIGAILLALAVTSGIFAYTATTTKVGLLIEAKPDFATVEPNETDPPTWNAFGSYRGRVGTGDLFTITPEEDWTGDMSVLLTIVNGDDLVEAYRILIFKIEIWDQKGYIMGTTEYLTLGRGEVDIEFEQTESPYTVKLRGGYYITHHAGWTDGAEDPLILCQVLQRSTP